MSVIVRTKIEIMASLDADEKRIQFSRPDSTLSQVSETFDLESSDNVELAASEADYALPLGKIVTVRYLYIETNGDITVKLDGEATGHVVGASSSGLMAKLVLRTTFTAAPLITNNSSAAAAIVSYFMAGMKT